MVFVLINPHWMHAFLNVPRKNVTAVNEVYNILTCISENTFEKYKLLLAPLLAAKFCAFFCYTLISHIRFVLRHSTLCL